jgi:hypothetical protein
MKDPFGKFQDASVLRAGVFVLWYVLPALFGVWLIFGGWSDLVRHW